MQRTLGTNMRHQRAGQESHVTVFSPHKSATPHLRLRSSGNGSDSPQRQVKTQPSKKSSAPALEGLTHRHSAAIPEPSTFPHQRNPHPRIHEIRSFASKKSRFLPTERTNESSRRISNQVFSIPLFTFSSIECRPRLRFVFP